jgi:hypothetical protein
MSSTWLVHFIVMRDDLSRANMKVLEEGHDDIPA